MTAERLGNLFKIDGRWQKFTIYSKRHLCDICNQMFYTWKTYDAHYNHTDKEWLMSVDKAIIEVHRRKLLGSSPT